MAKKPHFDYKKALKSMRGKVTFNYDLRKRLSPGQKAAIRRASNTLDSNRNQRLIQPPRRSGESDPHFSRRISRLKKNFSQQGTSVKGVFISIPKNAKFRVVDDNILFTRGINGDTFLEKIVTFNKVRLLDDRFRRSYMRRVIRKESKGFDLVNMLLGDNRSDDAFRIADPDYPEPLINEIIRMLDFYPGSDQFVNGLVFTRESKTNKG